MEKDVKILNEIIKQIDGITKENLDKAIKMIDEEDGEESISEILELEYEEYKKINKYHEKSIQYECFNLHIKSTSNTNREEAA